MAIVVGHDGTEEGEIAERCCKCRTPTRFWYGEGAANVALCQRCAEQYELKDLPSKKDWYESERKLNRAAYNTYGA